MYFVGSRSAVANIERFVEPQAIAFDPHVKRHAIRERADYAAPLPQELQPRRRPIRRSRDGRSVAAKQDRIKPRPGVGKVGTKVCKSFHTVSGRPKRATAPNMRAVAERSFAPNSASVIKTLANRRAGLSLLMGNLHEIVLDHFAIRGRPALLGGVHQLLANQRRKFGPIAGADAHGFDRFRPAVLAAGLLGRNALAGNERFTGRGGLMMTRIVLRLTLFRLAGFRLALLRLTGLRGGIRLSSLRQGLSRFLGSLRIGLKRLLLRGGRLLC